MVEWLKTFLIVVGAIFVALVTFDIVIITLKKNRSLPNNRFGRYFAKNLVRFNTTIFLSIFMIIWMAPLVIGLIGSLTSQYTFEQNPGTLVPSDGYTFDNYLNLFNQVDANGNKLPVARWILNSFIVSTVSTVAYLILAGFAAYAFVFLKFKFRTVLFNFLLFTMVIPGIASTVPQLANMANLNISKSLLALILPGLGGVGGMYLIRQFYLGIPKDLIESASIDGASHFRIFIRIILPLAKSVFLVQGLFCFMGSWNDLLWPQLILGTSVEGMKNWTLQVGIAYISGNKTANGIGLSLASAVVSAIPILILYIITQNKIIDGVAASGVKG